MGFRLRPECRSNENCTTTAAHVEKFLEIISIVILGVDWDDRGGIPFLFLRIVAVTEKIPLHSHGNSGTTCSIVAAKKSHTSAPAQDVFDSPSFSDSDPDSRC